MMDTAHGRAEPAHIPASATDTHSSGSDLPHAWRQVISDRCYAIAYRAYRRLNFHQPPNPVDVANLLNRYARRLYGAAAPPWAELLDLARFTVARIEARGWQPTLGHFREWCRRNGRQGARARWEPTADARSTRNQRIIAARAGGKSVKDVAAEFALSERQVKNVANPDAVADWQQGQLAISSPAPDDSPSEILDIESSRVPVGESQLPPHWILGRWETETGRPASNAEALQLVSWAEDPEVDAWRLVHALDYCPGKRRPLAYLARALANGPEYLPDVRRRASPQALAYVAHGHVVNERAYLATCIRNAEPEPAPDRRDGFLESYRRRHGRLPWDNPPEPSTPEKSEHPEIPANRPDPPVNRRDPRPIEAQKSGQPTCSPSGTAAAAPKLEHGPCRHPLAGMLAAGMDLASAVPVECSDGDCRCRLYSDRGRIRCACHLPAATARQLAAVAA